MENKIYTREGNFIYSRDLIGAYFDKLLKGLHYCSKCSALKTIVDKYTVSTNVKTGAQLQDLFNCLTDVADDKICDCGADVNIYQDFLAIDLQINGYFRGRLKNIPTFIIYRHTSYTLAGVVGTALKNKLNHMHYVTYCYFTYKPQSEEWIRRDGAASNQSIKNIADKDMYLCLLLYVKSNPSSVEDQVREKYMKC